MQAGKENRKQKKRHEKELLKMGIKYTNIYMEFRKMVMIILYARQKKRHRFIEQSFRLCGRGRGWDVSREQHRNMYVIKGETDHQPRLDA